MTKKIEETITKKHHALGTNIVLTLFGTTNQKILDQSTDLIDYYEDLLTVNRAESELMDVNYAAGEHAVTVSNSTYQLAKLAVMVSREEQGFNALIGPLVKLWKIGFAGANVPTNEEIQARLNLINPNDVELDDKELSIFLKKPGMEIDLGGIAKGYIADRVRDLWRAYDVRAGIINLGGNLLFVGTAPAHADDKWRIGIQNPLDKRGEIIASVTLEECSAVTSGIYERTFTKNGKQYHHILNPLTGYPTENNLLSVTVFTKKSVDAEIYTTQFFFNGAPEASWYLIHPDVYGAVFVTKAHEIIVSGLANIPVQILNLDYVLMN